MTPVFSNIYLKCADRSPISFGNFSILTFFESIASTGNVFEKKPSENICLAILALCNSSPCWSMKFIELELRYILL